MSVSDTAAGDMQNLIRIATTDLTNFLDKHLPTLTFYWWRHKVINNLNGMQRQVAEEGGFNRLEHLDFAALLMVLEKNWSELRQKLNLKKEVSVWITELRTVRNKWAHMPSRIIDASEVYRDADTMGLALKELEAPQLSLDTIEEVKRRALSEMTSTCESTSEPQGRSKNSDRKTNPILNHHPLPTGLQKMHICDQLVISARYLEAQGLTQQQLSSMHHFSLRGYEESFPAAYEYFGVHRNIQSRNRNYADRLIFVAAEHQKTGSEFTKIIDQALNRWPLW